MTRTRRKTKGGGLFGFGSSKAPPPPPPPKSSKTQPPPPPPPQQASDNPAESLVTNNLYTSLRLRFPNGAISSNDPSYAYNPITKKVNRPLNMRDFLTYELEIQQISYLARLSYSASGVLLKALKQGIMRNNYKSADNLITNLEKDYYDIKGWDRLFLDTGIGKHAISEAGAAAANIECGRFFPECGCTMILYQDTSNGQGAPGSTAAKENIPVIPINQKPTLYVVFKGSSSVRDFKSDLTLVKEPLQNIPQLRGKPGVDGKVHKGFYTHMANDLDMMLSAVRQYKATLEAMNPQCRIVVCGHSLGGAMATLFSYILCKNDIRFGDQPIECFTYGAPTMFSDDARNSFNECLKNNQLLLNRVWASKDGITIIPPMMSHPGYKPGKLEGLAQSVADKTGRSVDVNVIRKVFSDGNYPYETTDTLSLLEEDNEDLNNYPEFKRLLNSLLDSPKVIKETKSAAQEADEAAGNVETSAAVAAASNGAPETTGEQSGGAFAFGFTSGARQYKRESQSAYATSIQYLCTKPGCHPGYGGTGFMSALRIPTPGLRKREPTVLTKFFKTGAPVISQRGSDTYIKDVNGNIIPKAIAPQSGGRRMTHKKRGRGKKLSYRRRHRN